MALQVIRMLNRPWAIARRPLGAQAGWVIGPFAVQQAVRLATNIVLARLLAPEMFGLMLIVNTLRTGTELLTDIGIGQSVVRAKRAPDPVFLDTAWTLQVARGALLTLVMLILAAPLASLYAHELQPILFVVSFIFVISGLQSPTLFLVQRNMALRQRAAYDLTSTLTQCALTIALACVIPSVWALVWGLMVSTAFSSALSYALRPRRLPRLAWHPAHVREILHFGKWVFLATLIYFAATSTDKAVFGAMVPMAMVGVYSVARTFSDMAGQLAQRLGAFVVFPKIASFGGRHQAAAGRLRQTRRRVLTAIALALGLAVAVGDKFILLCYDGRYHPAAFMLPVLLFGVWFAILSNFAEAMLLGCDRPAQGAAGNAAKFVSLAIGLPLALGLSGLLAGLLAMALAEAARWLVLTRALVRENFTFIVDDLALTALFLGAATAAKLLLGPLGVVPTVFQWWALGRGILG